MSTITRKRCFWPVRIGESWVEDLIERESLREHREKSEVSCFIPANDLLTSLCRYQSHLSPKCIGHCERGGYPAECIDDMRRYSTDNTRNGISDILCGGDDQRTSQKQDGGEHVVQSEHGIVRLDFLKLKVILQASE